MFCKKNCLFSTRALPEESPPEPCLRPWIAIKIWLNFVSKGSINNDPALVQIMAWCRSATSHYLIEWWPSSLTHISVAGNKRIVIYGGCRYAMQRHRFTMNYQKARCNTQHQPPPYASTGTQRGYADFRRHLPNSLVIWWLAFIRDQNCLCVVCCTPGIESTWIKISITVTSHEHQPVPRLCITGPLLGGTAVHQWIPSQRVSNTENVSMMWCMISCLI